MPPARYANANPDELLEMLRPLGLLKRSTFLKAAARMVVDEHGGEVPDSEKELLKLPGVGLYVARSVLANAFGQPTAVLDTNVSRILERFFGLGGQRIKSRDKELWALAAEVAPESEVSRWNLTLLDFGAKVCTALRPKCSECPLQPGCCYGRELLEAS